MKRFLPILAGLVAAFVTPAAASAQAIYDETNLPAQTNTPVSIDFTAGSASTTLAFEGYQLPGFINLSDIGLFSGGSSTNLLGTDFAFTPAGCGSLAGQSGVGSNGTNNLSFGGVCAGSYDSLAQSISTAIGGMYTLSFNLSNSGANAPSGLRITASDASLTGAVPEPGTWAMMLVGFGAAGVSLRRRKVASLQVA